MLDCLNKSLKLVIYALKFTLRHKLNLLICYRAINKNKYYHLNILKELIGFP